MAAQKRLASAKADYTQQADTFHVIADVVAVAADINLLRIDGKPRFAPQRTVLVNKDAGASVVIVTPEKGVDLTINLAIGQSVTIDHPLKAIEDTGTTGTVQAFFYWWDTYGSTAWNQEA